MEGIFFGSAVSLDGSEGVWVLLVGAPEFFDVFFFHLSQFITILMVRIWDDFHAHLLFDCFGVLAAQLLWCMMIW